MPIPPNESVALTDEEEINENEFEKKFLADIFRLVEVFTHKLLDESDKEIITFVPYTSKDQSNLKRKWKLSKKKV